MKRNIIFLLLALLIPIRPAYTEHLGDTLTIGKGNAATKKIVAKRASGSTNPALQWNESTSRWEFSNNGTSFTAMGSGSGGSGINYITEWDAEDGLTTGWATYADAAGSSPVDGTGGSANVTFTNSSSTPLRGNNSFLFTKDASNRQGQGAAYAYTINNADKNKVLAVSFDHTISSGTFVGDDSADLQVFMYDVTNSALIPVVGNKLTSGTGPHKFAGTFQTTSSTSYRLILHVASTSASAYVIKLDNVSVGPQIVQYGAPVNDFTSCTASGSWVSNTTYTCFERRVGDSAEYFIRLALSGAPTSANLTVTIPRTIDTAKLGSLNTNDRSLGIGTAVDTGTNNYSVRVGYASANSVSVHHYVTSGSFGEVNASVTESTPFTFTNGDFVDLNFKVPVVGWSSTVQMSNDTDTRVVIARINGDPASASSGNPIIFPSTVFDSHGGYNTSTGRYTVPVTGYYKFYGYLGTGNGGVAVSVYKNAIEQVKVGHTDSELNATEVVGALQANAGDIIDLRPGGTLDVNSTSSIVIERLSGPSAIAASEKVFVHYQNNGGTVLTGGTTNIDFATKFQDSHGAWSGTVFTSPKSGFYNVSGMYRLTSSTDVQTSVYKNGSNFMTVQDQSGANAFQPFSFSLYLLAGETFSLRQGGSVTLQTGAGDSWISISSQ